MILAIGAMSGTSCDGVDAVLLELQDVDRRHAARVLAHAYVAFPAALQTELRDPDALPLRRVATLGWELAQHYADAVRALPDWSSAEVVGMHGQTVWHAPPSHGPAVACTLQLGSSGALAQSLRLPVVGDMRSADVALGGEGAPIAPIAHFLLSPPAATGRLVVNVGGIANVTFVGETADDVVASDVGPGMMITDALAQVASDGRLAFDRDGVLAATGTPRSDVVEHVLAHPFFARPLPRSTGREDFGLAYTQALMRRFPDLDARDLLASSIEATAVAITATARSELSGVTEILLTGGGARHPVLVAAVRRLSGGIPVATHDDGVFAPSHHEPAAMALIAARTLRGLPSSLPRVTGARRAAILGHVHRPS